MKIAKVEYIESGSFVGGEEQIECDLGIEFGEICVVMKKSVYEKMAKQIKELKTENKTLSQILNQELMKNTNEKE